MSIEVSAKIILYPEPMPERSGKRRCKDE